MTIVAGHPNAVSLQAGLSSPRCIAVAQRPTRTWIFAFVSVLLPPTLSGPICPAR